ncbi:MAG: hypothetical protein SV429_05415 [Pseudomonadota bacterium]|nr:hypothetical protein [Pseudomonadota bacterium]
MVLLDAEETWACRLGGDYLEGASQPVVASGETLNTAETSHALNQLCRISSQRTC